MDPIVFAQAGQGGGSLFSMFIPMVLILAIFYFLLILPQQRKQKAHQAMIRNLKKGDRVVTTGGIFGTVQSVKDDRLVVKISDDVKIELVKNQVAQLVGEKES
jgi:preprotein translocase subunit YajC